MDGDNRRQSVIIDGTIHLALCRSQTPLARGSPPTRVSSHMALDFLTRRNGKVLAAVVLALYLNIIMYYYYTYAGPLL